MNKILIIVLIIFYCVIVSCNRKNDITGDTTSPVISNVQAINIGASRATITWNTDEPATSAVEYGFVTIDYVNEVTDSNLVINHSITLTEVSTMMADPCHYRVKSTDSDGNTIVSSDYTFTTLPYSYELQVTNITNSQAIITWKTGDPGTSEVEYGLDTNYGLKVTDSNMVTSHSITLDGLSSQTTYYFWIKSLTEIGLVEGDEKSFFTL